MLDPLFRHLTYVSSATQLFSGEDLGELLRQSRLANEREDITGMLLYKGGNFMQAIEGPDAAIAALSDRVRRDPRHKGFSVLLTGTRNERLFEDWSMGFRDLTADAVGEPGYSEFLDSEPTAETFGENPGASQRLLLMFRRNMER